MRKTRFLLLASVFVLLVLSCGIGERNPFFAEYDTPFKVPPFSRIRNEHFMPAFREGIKRQQAEIDAIAGSAESPTFANTIEALENSGELLHGVDEVFFGMKGFVNNDEMQGIAEEVAPLLSEHGDNIILNEDLFVRVKSLYDRMEELGLTPEQERCLEKRYKRFARNGALLGEEDKARLREINKELSVLSLKFGDNVRAETSRFELVIGKEEDLAGLPGWVISTAEETALDRGHDGNWVFTLDKPSMIPFLQFSERRELREKIYKAYYHRGDNFDDLDNKEIAKKILTLRLERANMLGYETHAHFKLDEMMAKEPGNVYALLEKLWKPALLKAKEEKSLLQSLVYREGNDFELKSWDWWYYAEKLKKEKYDIDDEILKPYFPLQSVMDGAFMVAGRLFGLTFEERTDIPKYHEDARTFEVKGEGGEHVGLFYVDYFPREGKRGGAWMGSFRKQYRRGGEMVTPIIYNGGNFSKPTGDMPALLNFDEVNTIFHELGHALHGLLSEGTYRSMTGTSVATDFVELPSQIMENWATHPEVLKMYARHYETGEPIPDELIAKIKNASLFNQGFAATEYLAASILDMDWYTETEPAEVSVNEFERRSMDGIGLISEILPRYRTTYFRHIFSSMYSAGYYSYIWAEVLDADAFQVFKDKGLFDRATAESFRENILSKGDSEDPMELYIRFRGGEPSIEPLLERRGLKQAVKL
jgi:peptidyl-dipeptidase Dcp